MKFCGVLFNDVKVDLLNVWVVGVIEIVKM